MPTTREVLKSYFEMNDVPTAVQFAELIDSFYHITEDQINAGAGAFANLGEAQAGTDNTKYMNPLLVKAAIAALTTLANAPILANDIQTLIDLNIDDIEAAIATASDDVDLDDGAILATAKAVHDLNALKEDAFAKNSAFNKNFGFDNGTVLQGDKVIVKGFMIYWYFTGNLQVVSQNGTHLSGAWGYVNNLAGGVKQVIILHGYGANNYIPTISISSNSALEQIPFELQRVQANTFEFIMKPSAGNNNLRIHFELNKI